MLRLAFGIAALSCLAGCGAKGPTYNEALQMCEAEQRIYDQLDEAADALVIKDTRNIMARTERIGVDRGRIDPNQSESEYQKKLAEIEAQSAKERADEMRIFKERLNRAKAERDAQVVKLDAAKRVVDALSKSKQ